MIRLLFAIVPALWVVVIAIVSVQNATPVSLRLLTLQSIEIPFGLLLAFGVAGGMVGTAGMLLVLGANPLKRRQPRRNL